MSLYTKIEKIKKLTTELLHHCHLYYDLDAPEISDSEYDKKFDALKHLEDETNFWLANSPTRKVQGSVLPYLTKVHHSVPMLSADKSTDIEDVKKFIGDKAVVASFKLDGSTVVLKYRDGKLIQGLSRGSGIDGEDITHTVKMIKNLPSTIPYKGYLEVRGEALIPLKYYNEMNVDNSLGHPRNVASGALRQLDANEASKRNVYFYAFTLVNWKDIDVTTKTDSLDFLFLNGFDVVPHTYIPAHDTIKDIPVLLDRTKYENPTDGWCFEYDDLEYGESLGSTEHHDRRLYALKPARTDYTTYFRGIEYKTCRTGVVSLTAIFDPVEIDNTIISRATLHNCDYFNNLELGEGDEIVVAKMNEIIPAVLDNNTRSGTYKLIDQCQSCGTKLIVKNTGTANVLYCPNEDCASRNLSKFTHFVSKNCIDIRGLSERTLEVLISHGFLHTTKDIYHLSAHRNKLINLDGMGEKSVSTMLKSIEDSRTVNLEKFINALGIEGIGLSTAKLISETFHGDFEAFIKAFESNYNWSDLEGVGDVLASNIDNYLSEKQTEVRDLASEFTFVQTQVSNDNTLNGLRFCITGSFTQSRDVLKAQLEAKGAKFVSGVSKNLDVLFCGDNAGSKLTKAQTLGVKVADEKQLLAMLGE